VVTLASLGPVGGWPRPHALDCHAGHSRGGFFPAARPWLRRGDPARKRRVMRGCPGMPRFTSASARIPWE